MQMRQTSRGRCRRDYVGQHVVTVDGQDVGAVIDTWPQDGGGEVEMMLLKTTSAGGRFAQRRWIPVDGTTTLNEYLFVSFSLNDIDEAPDAEDHRWGRPADIAKAHWAFMLDD